VDIMWVSHIDSGVQPATNISQNAEMD
jgi:hypothetical protein